MTTNASWERSSTFRARSRNPDVSGRAAACVTCSAIRAECRTRALRKSQRSFAAPNSRPEVDPNVRATVWLKLVNNCGLNPVSVLRGMTIKPMLADPDARAQVHAMMNEALRVGQAMGVVAEVDVDERIAYAARLDDVKTSMLQDYERGRELELDPILGAVIELGERYGVDVPHSRDAYRRLRQMSGSGSPH